MKTIIKSTLSILLGMLLMGSVVVAQDQSQTIKPVPRKNKNTQILTDNQKAMQKANQEKRKVMKEAFKATVSQDQKDILSDPRLVKADRNKKFRASLTDKQVGMIKARQQEVKNENDQFRATLTDQQKMQLKKRALVRNRTNGARPNRPRAPQLSGGI